MNTFITEDKIKQDVSIFWLLKQLWKYARRHVALLITCFIAVALISLFSRLMPTIIGYAIDEGFIKKNTDALLYAALLFLAVMVGQAISEYIQGYFFQRLGNRILFYIREDLVLHTQNLPIEYFNRTPIGRIVTRLTNDPATLADVFSETLFTIIVNLSVLISIVVAMAVISPKLAFITLVVAPPFVWYAYRLTLKSKEILRESKKSLSTLNSYIAENVNGISVVQLYNRKEKNQTRFLKLSNEYKQLTVESIKASAKMQPVMNLFNAFTIAIALYYGGILGMDSALALGSLVAFVLHAQDIIHPLRDILERYQNLQNSITSAERVFHLLEEPAETFHGTEVPRLRGEIEFKNLQFRYQPQLPLVLKNVNLKIKSGEKIAIVGRTGSGKSTLISLLQRFYEAPPEQIFIDGQTIESYHRQALRRRIGVIQQESFIFRGTLAENISIGNPEITRERILRALQRVGYDAIMTSQQRDLDFFIEERGANLSAGERQLISFARIIAYEPDILILDEATSNIDSQSEQLIQHATAEITAQRTSLIIAHRLSTIRDCDRIIFIDHGEILEQGTHEELMQKRGAYYQVASAGVKSTLILS